MTGTMPEALPALAGTVACFAAAHWLHGRTRHHPLTHPVLLSVTVIILALLAGDWRYEDYFADVQFLHLMLGPATVALAIPLHRYWDRLGGLGFALVLTLIVGSMVAMGLAGGFAALGGGDPVTILTILPKSATAPVAMDLAALLGGLPGLAAALVILTGTLGAAFGPWWLRFLGITDHRAVGFALGLVSHGIGTAAAFRLSSECGVFATLGMGLNAVMTTLLVAVITGLV